MPKKKNLAAPAKLDVSTRLPSVNLDSTADILALSSPKPKNLSGSSLLTEAVNVMTNKLRRAYWWVTGIRENGQMYKVPSTVRGNDTYAYYQSARIQQIQQFLTDNLKIKYQDEKVTATNALFITLTQQYNPHEEEDIIRTWLNMRAALKKFKSRMRRLNMTDFALTLEAHASGGCHAHMIAIFGDRGIGIHKRTVKKKKRKYRHGSESVYRLNDTGLLYKIKKAWADALCYSLDRAFVDVIGCGDSDLANYITKELKKASSCEKALKLLKQETGAVEKEKRDAARKKVLAFYFADKLKMRLLHVSKGIGAKAEPEEGEMPEAEFIEQVISEPPKGQRVLFSCMIKRQELLKLIRYDEISPYTGAVEPISKEGAALMSIFEERFQISKVLGNKREIERVIAGREAAKLVKKKTAAIAKQAIYA